MRHYALLLALAALLALAGLAAVALLRPAEPPTLAEQAHQLAAELRCPDCQVLSVAQSHTAAAAAIRSEIRDLLAAGQSVDAVRAHFVASYGEWILLSPTAPIAWWLPVAAFLGGAALLTIRLRQGRSRPEPAGTAATPPDADLRARVRAELEELDA